MMGVAPLAPRLVPARGDRGNGGPARVRRLASLEASPQSASLATQC